MPELVEYGPLPEPKSKRRERLNEKTGSDSLREALAEALHEIDQLRDQVERLKRANAGLLDESARLRSALESRPQG